MTYRANEYIECGLKARWLDPVKARNAFEHAHSYVSKEKWFSLNANLVSDIERLHIESDATAAEWLKRRVSGEGSVQVVHGPQEVCVVDAAPFLLHWQEVLLPSRDDAVVLHNSNPTIFIFSHEEELELGNRFA
jgi:hypothetical protein